MTNRVARVAVLMAALGSVAAAAYVVFDAEQGLKSRQAARAGFDGEAQTVLGDLGRLRAAEQAYVAEGQGLDYWTAQATDALGKVDRGLAAMASDATGDATRSAIQAASGVLEEFRKQDQRARQYVKTNQMVMASDVIFADGMTAGNAVGEHVATARANEASVYDAAIEDLRWRELYAMAGAALVLTLAVLLLAPVPEREVDVLTAMRALTEASVPHARRMEPAFAAEAPAARMNPEAPNGRTNGVAAARPVTIPDDDVPDLEAVMAVTGRRPEEFADAPVAPVAPTSALGGASTSAALAASPSAAGAATGDQTADRMGDKTVDRPDASTSALGGAAVDRPDAPIAPTAPVLDLPGAAKVCADMARVLHADDLPGLMLRLAEVLGAPGLIVWVADRSGQVLMPLLTHGYPASAVARIGSLPTSASNATAMAWRTGEVQVVPGTTDAPAALVAPIVTAEGCVGALAAEVPAGAEGRTEVRALATIFAAQLATFVTALPSVGGQTVAAEA